MLLSMDIEAINAWLRLQLTAMNGSHSSFLLGEATKAAALRTISNQANSGDMTQAIALGTAQTHSSLPSARKACAWSIEPNRAGRWQPGVQRPAIPITCSR